MNYRNYFLVLINKVFLIGSRVISTFKRFIKWCFSAPNYKFAQLEKVGQKVAHKKWYVLAYSNGMYISDFKAPVSYLHDWLSLIFLFTTNSPITLLWLFIYHFCSLELFATGGIWTVNVNHPRITGPVTYQLSYPSPVKILRNYDDVGKLCVT